jgi:hypothetical protein
VEGSSHREAARELGLSEPALRGLVYRARAALRATAGAFVPGPVVSWALGTGSGASMGERVAEVSVGGGGAGVAGLLMKGGAMAVTAGVLAGGIAAVHAHPKQTGRKQTSVSAHRDRDLEAAHLALASAGSSSVRPVADSRRTSEAGRSLPAHGSAPKTKRAGERGRRGRAPAGIAPASVPMWPNRHGGGDRRDAANGGGVSHEGQRDSGAKGGGGTDATGGGGRTLSGGGSGSGDGGGGSSGDAAIAGSTDGSQADGGGDHGGQSGQATDTSGSGEPSTGDHSSAGMTITNVSPTSEPSPSEGGKD